MLFSMFPIISAAPSSKPNKNPFSHISSSNELFEPKFGKFYLNELELERSSSVVSRYGKWLLIAPEMILEGV